MALDPGTRLGPYEILATIGAGGMGEVYRARDTRLDRSVAVKILPAHLSSSPELRQRFEREARSVSSLNHPNICTLHDVGEQDGIHFLVMELVQGETLQARLERGPMSPAEALPCAIQIADALDRAHRQGVVHRDLKPGNIMLTKAGAKLLDFGLAKAAEAGPAALAGMTAAPTAHSPLTAQGMVIGTFHYMAPEQLEGAPADARSDIFSFGLVLYQMLTGRRAFEGKTHASLAAAILKEAPPPLSALAPVTPPALERLVGSCLEKDPDERRQTMHDILLDLRGIAGEGGRPAEKTSVPRPAEREASVAGQGRIALGIVLLLAALGAGYFLGSRPRTSPPQAGVSFEFTPPEGIRFRVSIDDDNLVAPPVISPDGTRIVFGVTDAHGHRNLWIRSLGEFEPKPIPNTEGAVSPFWSPDGQSIGFSSDGKLRRLSLAGGTTVTLADVGNIRGASWSTKGTILYTPSPNDGLYKIPAAGGTPAQVTFLDPNVPDLSHRWPTFLPDGERFVFLVWSNSLEVRNGIGGIYTGSLSTRETSRLLELDTSPVLVPGWILFAQGRNLMAAQFDGASSKITGEVRGTGEEVQFDPSTGRAQFSVSDSGNLVFMETSPTVSTRLVWIDRTGAEAGEAGPVSRYGMLRLSPDGGFAAISTADPQKGDQDVYLMDLSRRLVSKFTIGPSDDTDPIWSPDSRRIAYASDADGPFAVYLKPADGSGSAEKTLTPKQDDIPVDWSPDGRRILLRTIASGTTASGTTRGFELWVIDLGARSESRWLSRGEISDGRFSPDGSWVAYVTNESGRDEVYVGPFPGPGPQIQISIGGGRAPRFRQDARELIYQAGDGSIMSVELQLGSSVKAGIPRKLFSMDLDESWDATRDHQRFLVAKREGRATSPPLKVVTGWAGSLRTSQGP